MHCGPNHAIRGECTVWERIAAIEVFEKMARGLILWACACTLACTEQTPPMWKSGARLVALIQEVEGFSRFVSWYDIELDVACSYQYDKAGELRCLPAVGAIHFTDPGRKNPVLLVSAACGGPAYTKYASERLPPRACSTETLLAVYNTGERLQPPDRLADVVGIDPLAWDFFEAKEVEPSTFVKPTIESVEFEGGLSLQRAITSDGSELTIGILNSSNGESCQTFYNIHYQGPYRDSCLTERHFEHTRAPRYSNDTCTEPTPVIHLAEPRSDCGARKPAFFAAKVRGENCADSLLEAVYPVGAEAPATKVYRLNDDFCELEPTTATDQTYVLEPPIAPESLPALLRKVEGDTVLMETFTTAGGAPLLQIDGFKNCRLMTLDGALRCVPSATSISESVFSDPECTLPALVDGSCRQPAYAVLADTPACGATVYGTRLLGESVEVFRRGSSGECTSVAVSAGAKVYDLFRVDAWAFPEVSQRLDPSR